MVSWIPGVLLSSVTTAPRLANSDRDGYPRLSTLLLYEDECSISRPCFSYHIKVQVLQHVPYHTSPRVLPGRIGYLLF